MTSALRAQGLTKDYGSGHGLFDLDLEVEAGEIFGYLGPNGAGKTTTIRLLMELITAARGSAEILGMDVWASAVPLKRILGYVPGELPDFGSLRGRDLVAYIGGLRGSVDHDRVNAIAGRFDLDLTRRFREYSRGNKQKLAIVLAFMHEPRVLILDEPTGGLDPLNQQTFYDMVREARARGATVFLSSHVLSEVEHVCDRVGIIRDGRLVRIARLDELHEMRVHHVEAVYRGRSPAAGLRGLDECEDLTEEDQRVRFTVRGAFASVLAVLGQHDIVSLTSREPSLEEVFLAYYGEQAPAPPSP